ncbi:MAG: 3-dehydroquinate synthase [Caulobacteraceae bacterium]|nr:3-dehydroquinate synthase [Caulobacteraceae bacterium]
MMQRGVTVPVDLGERSYEVRIGPGLIDRAAQHIGPLLKRQRLAVVTDSHVGDHHGERLAAALEKGGIATDVIVMPAGEETKSFRGLEDLTSRLLALELDRGDLICAFGGGVIGDLTGFAAAIYKRGIDFIQIPTTLLAQVDSSVGGKTAIDAPAGKNLIGAFHQPRLVLADLDVLATLPNRELRAGFAEVIKYGLLGDAEFFSWLEAHTAGILASEPACLARAIARSVEMKAQIVGQDEKEGGVRALLNLGHTFAHALEAETGYGDAFNHGEAVAVGMVLAFDFSAALGLCDPAQAARARRGVAAAGLPTTIAQVPGAPFAADRLIHHMGNDKKASGGGLTFILARGIGQAFVVKGVDPAPLRDFLVAQGAGA